MTYQSIKQILHCTLAVETRIHCLNLNCSLDMHITYPDVTYYVYQMQHIIQGISKSWTNYHLGAGTYIIVLLENYLHKCDTWKGNVIRIGVIKILLLKLVKYYLNNVKEFKKQYICKTKTECYNDRLEEYFRIRKKIISRD